MMLRVKLAPPDLRDKDLEQAATVEMGLVEAPTVVMGESTAKAERAVTVLQTLAGEVAAVPPGPSRREPPESAVAVAVAGVALVSLRTVETEPAET